MFSTVLGALSVHLSGKDLKTNQNFQPILSTWSANGLALNILRLVLVVEIYLLNQVTRKLALCFPMEEFLVTFETLSFWRQIFPLDGLHIPDLILLSWLPPPPLSSCCETMQSFCALSCNTHVWYNSNATTYNIWPKTADLSLWTGRRPQAWWTSSGILAGHCSTPRRTKGNTTTDPWHLESTPDIWRTSPQNLKEPVCLPHGWGMG